MTEIQPIDQNNWKSRWTRVQIQTMLLEQSRSFWQQDTGTERTLLGKVEQAIHLPHAVIISGLRRVGKSTLMAQLAHRLGEDSYYYINFEDERLIGFQAENANDLYQALLELFGERRNFIVDEIQNVAGWEHFVRRFMDMGFKFYATGSNASLLSRDLGSRLTGRYVPFELFPFSFEEYLRFRKQEIPDGKRFTTIEQARLQRSLYEYLSLGGIPDPLKYPELPLLKTLYDDVLYRDIATRYRIEDVRALKELAYFLVSNPAGPISFNKLKDQIGVGSINTIRNYIEFLENSWLIFILNVYDFSVKRQQIAPKKVYCIDTGLASAVGFSFSDNHGKLLENLVFLGLRRKSQAIYYYTTASGYEIDFYLPDDRLIIQVTQSMEQAAVRDREVRALTEAMQALKLNGGMILTNSDAEPIQVAGGTIEIRSIASWLLEQ